MDNTLQILWVLAVFTPSTLLAWYMSYHPAVGGLRWSLLNPFLLVMLFIFLLAIDYSGLAVEGHGTLLNMRVPVDPDDFYGVAARHATMMFAFILGMAAPLMYRHNAIVHAQNQARAHRVNTDQRLATRERRTPQIDQAAIYSKRSGNVALVIFVCLMFYQVYIAVSSSGSYFSVDNYRQIRYDLAGDALYYTLSLALFPALSYVLGSGRSLASGTIISLVAAIVLFFSGSRTQILNVIIPYLFFLIVVKNFRIPRHFFLIAAAAGIMASMVGLNVRQNALSGGGDTFSFQTSEFLNSADISMADIAIAMDKLPGYRTTFYPGQDILSAFTAPFPRAIVRFKPLPSSVRFTRAYNPILIEWGSSYVISIINEVSYDYPIPFAAIILFGMGSLWGYLWTKAMKRQTPHSHVFLAMLYMTIYNTFRNDIFIMAGAWWSWLAAWLVIESWLTVKRSAFSLAQQTHHSSEWRQGDARR